MMEIKTEKIRHILPHFVEKEKTKETCVDFDRYVA